MLPRLPIVFIAAVLLLARPGFGDESESAGISFFEKRIRPVLAEHCFPCHSAQARAKQNLKGGLRLDDRTSIRQGGDSGPAVVPGHIDDSLLIGALRHEDYEMPPQGKLPDNVIADFVRWVEMGAPWPDEAAVVVADEPEIDWEVARKFWSFQRPQQHTLPPVEQDDWPRKRSDYFLLAKMEAAGLSPAARAEREVLIRRVFFDLVGLPPRPEQIDEFLRDESPQAYQRLVDRLLASPHYGEHFARLWLDVARYAEDQAHIVGKNSELFYPNAYLYREWLIRAVNEDLPYDTFIKLQLAADFLDEGDSSQHAALGFIGLGPKYYRRNSLAVQAEEWEDRVDTVTRGLLGLTVACARCHDHKFDPLRTEDYYALAGVFASSEMFNRRLDGQDDKPAKAPKDALHVVRDRKPQDLNVFIRGNVEQKGPLVKRRFLQVLCADEPKPFTQGSGRLELAESIAALENPLTARVIVNRVWARTMSRPLVGTPSNFGALGESPTHPQLLDDLAVRFMEAGWSLKWLHRDIVLSAAYQLSSRADQRDLAADQDNRLYARAHRRRLSIEQWRDAMLVATGELDGAIGGPSFESSAPDERRRTVYSRISRLELNKMLALFDFPEPNVHAARRSKTTTPLQKLFTLNSPFMARRAETLARHLNELETTGAAAEAVDGVYRSLYGRRPTAEESQLCLTFLAGTADQDDSRWQQLAHVLLAANEMLYVD